MPIHRQLAIPHINVSHIITSDDLLKIDDYLSGLTNKTEFKYYFHPKLYLAHIKYKQKKKIIDIIYQLLKKVYPSINESIIHIIKSNQYDMITFPNNIGILKLKKPINSNNNIIILILENPMIWNQYTLQFIILFSCIDKKHYIYNQLYDALNNLSQNLENIHHILDNPIYPNFLNTLLDNLD